MNTKDFTRLGVLLGQATRRATDFIGRFILGGGDKSRLEELKRMSLLTSAATIRWGSRRDLKCAMQPIFIRWGFEGMNTKDFIRLGVPLGQATRRARRQVAAGGESESMSLLTSAATINWGLRRGLKWTMQPISHC